MLCIYFTVAMGPNAQDAHLHTYFLSLKYVSKLQILRTHFLGSYELFAHSVLNSLYHPCFILSTYKFQSN